MDSIRNFSDKKFSLAVHEILLQLKYNSYPHNYLVAKIQESHATFSRSLVEKVIHFLYYNAKKLGRIVIDFEGKALHFYYNLDISEEIAFQRAKSFMANYRLYLKKMITNDKKTNIVGRMGEGAVRAVLRKLGFTVLQRVRAGKGDIDLIAMIKSFNWRICKVKEFVIAFEVKNRDKEVESSCLTKFNYALDKFTAKTNIKIDRKILVAKKCSYKTQKRSNGEGIDIVELMQKYVPHTPYAKPFGSISIKQFMRKILRKLISLFRGLTDLIEYIYAKGIISNRLEHYKTLLNQFDWLLLAQFLKDHSLCPAKIRDFVLKMRLSDLFLST